MNRVLFIIGLLFLAYSVIMFAVDFLPVDLFNKSNDGDYLKTVETDSISWSSYRVHALITGIALIVFSNFTNLFND